VLLLLKHGAAVNCRDKDNQTPLHLAIHWNQFKLAEILLEHGADADAEDIYSRTPLRILSESRSHDNGDFLNHAQSFLVHAVGVNLQDEDKKTSLLVGIGEAKYEFTEIIAEVNADASVENKMGTGDVAVRQTSWGNTGSQERVRGLALAQQSFGSGADLNVEEDNQMTPKYFQSNPGPFQIAVLLLYYGANCTIGNDGGKSLIYQEIKGEYYIRRYHTAFNESLMC
jgi:ankyrin repeat protein